MKIESYYEIVKELCEEKGVSIKALEEHTGLANGAVSKWKRKDASPHADNLYKIANFLNVTLEDILERRQESM